MKCGKRIGMIIAGVSVLLLWPGALPGYYIRRVFRLPLAEWVPTQENGDSVGPKLSEKLYSRWLFSAERRKILPAAIRLA